MLPLVEHVVTFQDQATNVSCGSANISNSSSCPEGICSLQYNTNALCPGTVMILVTVYVISKVEGVNASNSTLVPVMFGMSLVQYANMSDCN